MTERWYSVIAGLDPAIASEAVRCPGLGPGMTEMGSAPCLLLLDSAARNQQPIAPARAHAAGALGRLGPKAPEHVAAHRPLDRAAGILRHQQALHTLLRIKRILGVEPDRQAHRHKAA